MANEFKRMQKLAGIITESQINESKPYAMLATVADDWGKDSDIYGDLEAAVVGWTDRNGELSPKGKIAIKNLLSNWDLLDDYGFFIDNDEMNEGDTDYDRAKDAKRLGKKGEKNIYGAGVKKGEEIEKKKMKMSELKAAIKELALNESEEDFDLTAAFKSSPMSHSYEDVLEVIKSYEDDDMLDAFKAKFPKNKNISRKDYSNFTMDMIDDMSETSYIQANWISISDPDVYDKAGLNEGEDDINFNDDESLYDPVYEASEFDMNKPARIKEFIIALNKLVDEYHAELYLNDDLFAAIEMVIKAAKEEAMNSELSEAKKDEEVEDIKDVDVTVGDEETTADVTTVDVDPNVKAVQDALTQAQAAAEKLGDEKLTDQIGNTITFFTRSHIVDKPGMTAESNIKERINKLMKSL
jgi:hypothetical protein